MYNLNVLLINRGKIFFRNYDDRKILEKIIYIQATKGKMFSNFLL